MYTYVNQHHKYRTVQSNAPTCTKELSLEPKFLIENQFWMGVAYIVQVYATTCTCTCTSPPTVCMCDRGDTTITVDINTDNHKNGIATSVQ